MTVGTILLRLVEHAQHFLQPIVHLTMEKRYLHDNAVMDEALHEWVGNAIGHYIAIIIVSFMIDIEHWHIDVTNSMSQQVDGYHRNGIAVIVVLARHILRVAVLRTKILTETQGLRF